MDGIRERGITMSEILTLKNGSEYPVIVNGFVNGGQNGDEIRIGIITDKTLEEIIEEFSDAANTSEITLKNENNQLVAYAKDFTVLSNVVSMDTHYQITPAEYDQEGNVTTEAVYGKAVTLILKEQPIAARVAALEDTVDTLILDSLGI